MHMCEPQFLSIHRISPLLHVFIHASFNIDFFCGILNTHTHTANFTLIIFLIELSYSATFSSFVCVCAHLLYISLCVYYTN